MEDSPLHLQKRASGEYLEDDQDQLERMQDEMDIDIAININCKPKTIFSLFLTFLTISKHLTKAMRQMTKTTTQPSSIRS